MLQDDTSELSQHLLTCNKDWRTQEAPRCQNLWFI